MPTGIRHSHCALSVNPGQFKILHKPPGQPRLPRGFFRACATATLPQVDAELLGQRSAFVGLYLGRLIADLPAGHAVTMFGHSHGCRTVSSALHVLGGGQVQGYVLADRPKHKRRMRAIFAAAALAREALGDPRRVAVVLLPTKALMETMKQGHSCAAGACAAPSRCSTGIGGAAPRTSLLRGWGMCGAV